MHDLGDYTPPLSVKNKIVDRVDRFRLLGTLLSQDLKCTEHVNNVTSSCFGVLAVLRKIKNMTPQETKKSLVQSLVLSKLNFNDTVTILILCRCFSRKGCNEYRMQQSVLH